MENQYPLPPSAPKPAYPAGKPAQIFALLFLVFGWGLCNSLFFAGLNLGFSLFAGACILCSYGYLLAKGCRFTPYTGLLAGLSLVLTATFARSDDSFVKFVLFCFLLLTVNLSLCLTAGQNRRSASGLSSLLDGFRAAFVFGVSKATPAISGLRKGLKEGGAAGKKGGAVVLGLLIAIPLLALVIPLLIRADAAFDAVLQKLPKWDLVEILGSIILGTGLAAYFYVRVCALGHSPKDAPAADKSGKLSCLTVNTVLTAIAGVYAVYLFSQLAYFSGGFSGILPEGFTMAEYARRGFFEMAWLCAINLGIIALSVGLTSKKGLFTKLLCLFIGVVTLFLVVSASAKMFLYIDSYGLTRLRVLTEVVMLWLGLAAVIVCVWLFAPKLPYMKIILVAALLIGAAVAWADVDTVVARYNVNAYQSSKLDTVDVEYLNLLGNGAIPYVAQLTEDADPEVANAAKNGITWYYGEDYYRTEPKITEDIRGWNYVNHIAEQYIIFLEK